ncbi:Uu.00g050540.m01.CDS01 [Anthostomella pinea]|uniref:Uu.00g050540.m01.CDS01 n=1 Tax=Anthostomella pinea TaxID=933095 RepID=A0AAI8YK88_9PEZI|nr:Uu.00g050540.m01.CDS01 [Anthostomella pinea]
MNPRAGGQIIDLQTTPPDEVLNKTYRRNGRIQSCEPCRKSKLKCDHVLPACKRCVKRGCADRCVYHPSPLAKSRQTRTAAPPTPSTSTNDESLSDVFVSVDTPLPGSPLTSSPEKPPPPRAAEDAAHAHRAASAPPLQTHQQAYVRVNPGFLGATSFTSIFTENLGKFGVQQMETSYLQRIPISDDRIARGCQVLSFLKNRVLVNQFVARYFEICEGAGIICPEPIMKKWLMKLQLHHGDTLRDQDPEKIRRLCELLWRNTQSPLVFNEGTSAMQWARSATGPNIRWEVIGLIAAIIGQCANTLRPSDRFLKEHNVVRPKFPRQMNDVANTCMAFCRDCEALDDLFLWLAMENAVLTSTMLGDGSYASYRESGEVVNAVIAMGLHQDVRVGKNLPFFLEQLRKRVLVQTYSCDISIASFLGRPPRMSYRYCNLTPPLDVPDSQLFQEDVDKAQILASLDSNGFNTAGRVTRTTWMKTWLGWAPRREDVLDLALGHYTSEEVLRHAEEIRKKGEEYWAGLPAYIRRFSDGEVTPAPNNPFESMLQDGIKQGFRGNDLLLQRTLIRKTGATSEKLVRTARLILDDILRISRRHDIASVFQSDMASRLAVQGLRSAAVIAVELLKQEQLPSQSKNHLLPRSRTIQDLSVFAARLGDIDPADGAFSVCDMGSKVITRILDKILSPPNEPGQVGAPHLQHDQRQGLGQVDMHLFANETGPNDGWPVPGMDCPMGGDLNMEIDVPFLSHDNDFMQWLESTVVDWEKPIG